MDSLQVQAMNQAQDARRTTELTRIAAACERLECGEYGFCAKCGSDITPARLQNDSAVSFCLACA
ncbi:MAG: TraR/DksA C4-type zinc finger protein [Robiginitomaculum sp.]|nr:TraR/DksA C4-type zinc finger protein [Robiginitomaculum sp.]